MFAVFHLILPNFQPCLLRLMLLIQKKVHFSKKVLYQLIIYYILLIDKVNLNSLFNILIKFLCNDSFLKEFEKYKEIIVEIA